MSLTLFETFLQIDPFVKFTDGSRTATASELLSTADPKDTTEYAIDTDGVGRILIYKLSFRGCVISPPAFVEEKMVTPRGSQTQSAGRPDFGAHLHGFV